MPQVTWEEARQHLVSRLMIDEEWAITRERTLTWWASSLPTTIEVTGEGGFPTGSDNWIRLTGSTAVARVNVDQAETIAALYRSRFPVGVLTFVDNQLKLSTTFSFNPQNRSLLPWFHQCLLIQGVVALEIAKQLEGIDGVVIARTPHPTSGLRVDVDELVEIYRDSMFRLPVDEVTLGRYAEIRPRIRSTMRTLGYEMGYSDEEVDFYSLLSWANDEDSSSNPSAFDVGVGLMPGSEAEERFGPCLMISARILPPGVNFHEPETTRANHDLASLATSSVFGFIAGDESGEGGGQMRSLVPHLTLCEWSNLDDEEFALSVVNAILHVCGAALAFRREFLGIE